MAEETVTPEFDRPGSILREEYVAGLKLELDRAATDENRKEIKAELDRVAKLRSTATAARAEETA
jgi:hypothetical protein